jgi:fused signal recognition particle receptor
MLGSLREKLARTRQALKQRLDEVLSSGKPREEILEELSETLLLADVGVASTEKIVGAIRERTGKTEGAPEVRAALKAELVRILSRYPARLSLDAGPVVLMIVGVNGGGKTTSLAKIACRLEKDGRKVLLVAADTFRAAAQEQLSIWGRRLGVPVIKGQAGADPASVVFDALHYFKAHGLDVMLVDTAGRIHTDINLMSELEKIKRVIGREIAGAPQEVLLVLDATVGQNSLHQAREFLKFAGLTGVVLAKLDGTAKGGSVIGIADELDVPIKLVGTGEGEADMEEFSAAEFVDALFA